MGGGDLDSHRITFVLPLRGARDLATARRVLLPSLDTLFRLDDVAEVLVLGRAEELAAFDFSDVVSAALAARVRAVDERTLLPPSRSLLPTRGYDRQQALKLAVSARVGTRLYCTLDADVYLVARCGLADWTPGGRAIYNRYSMDAHPRWWRSAAHQLGVRDDFDRTHGFGVTPSLLHTDVARALVAHLEAWQGVLPAIRRGATEYTLYWLWVLSRHGSAALYHEGPPEPIGRAIWGARDIDRADPRVEIDKQFDARGRWFFSLVQSTTGLADEGVLAHIRGRIEEAARAAAG